MKFKMKIILFIPLLLASSQLMAVSAETLAKELYNILNICHESGFYQCEDDYFQGDARGPFHLPIETQRLKLTELSYRDFIEKNTKEGVSVEFFRKTVNIDFNLDKKYDLSAFSPNNIDGPIQPLNQENTLFKFNFNNAPPIVLIRIGEQYKIGILPEVEKAFLETNEFKTAYLYKLKNNILQYHMKEAEMMSYDMEDMSLKVSEAQAPIYFMLKKGDVPDLIKEYMGGRTFQDIQRFYIPLDSDEKIISKIKAVHDLE